MRDHLAETLALLGIAGGYLAVGVLLSVAGVALLMKLGWWRG